MTKSADRYPTITMIAAHTLELKIDGAPRRWRLISILMKGETSRLEFVVSPEPPDWSDVELLANRQIRL